MSITENLNVVLSGITIYVLCSLVTYIILEYPWGKK